MARDTHHGQAGQMPSAGCRDRSLDHPSLHPVRSGPVEKSRMDKHRLSWGLLEVHRHRHLAVGMGSPTADTRLADRYRCNWVHCGLLASHWWMGILELHTLKKEGIQMLAGSLPLVGMEILQDSQNSPDMPYWADSRGPVREGNLTLRDIHLA